MKYVIMADGDMKRWHSDSGIPKHLLTVNGETLLERIVRQLNAVDPGTEIIITSHNKEYDVPGAVRYEPMNNHLEIDRFTWELIEDGVCFLYGDTFYSDDAIKTICCTRPEGLSFVGTDNSIVAVLAGSGELLKQHIEKVKKLFLSGEITDCKGWQVYQSYTGLPFGQIRIGKNFILVSDGTCGFNTWTEYESFLKGGRIG